MKKNEKNSFYILFHLLLIYYILYKYYLININKKWIKIRRYI